MGLPQRRLFGFVHYKTEIGLGEKQQTPAQLDQELTTSKAGMGLSTVQGKIKKLPVASKMLLDILLQLSTAKACFRAF